MKNKTHGAGVAEEAVAAVGGVVDRETLAKELGGRQNGEVLVADGEGGETEVDVGAALEDQVLRPSLAGAGAGVLEPQQLQNGVAQSGQLEASGHCVDVAVVVDVMPNHSVVGVVALLIHTESS